MSAMELLKLLFELDPKINDYQAVAYIYKYATEKQTKSDLFDLYIKRKIENEEEKEE